MHATVGSLAPDFDMPCTPMPESGATRVRLSDFRGRWLGLVFYPRDFSLVCPTELTALSDRIEDFRRQGCQLLGISTDSVESHAEWIAQPRASGGLGGLNFALASDTDGSVCRAYNVYVEYQHVALRGMYFIDPNGVVQYQVVHNLSVGRRSDELLRVLAALQTGGLCAENWSAGQAIIDINQTLRPGMMFGHYRVERRIGTGAFASVYQALDTKLQRPVALKVLKADGGATPASILAEARAAAALNHPNVCTIYAVDDREGAPVIAMEYLTGQSLDKRLAAGAFDAAAAQSIVAQIADGMASAHELQIVHGDLKPGNVFLTDDGRVKILDFGLARRVPASSDPNATLDMNDLSQGVTGTPGYMSPEQAIGLPASPASDVFSLGIIFYELLTGHRAFPGDNLLLVLSEIRSVDPDRLAGEVAERFRPLLRSMLEPEPQRRTITMRDIAATLQELATSL